MWFIIICLCFNTITAFSYKESPEYLQQVFPTSPLVRKSRQATSPNYICAPQGTCITNTSTTIDPRIVTSAPICSAGQVPCYKFPGGEQCGVRYVPTVDTSTPLSSLGAYPWQAFLLNETGYTGSGVLIDEYHVLTIAHKVNLNFGSPANLRVYMGVHDPFSSVRIYHSRSVVSMVIHINYSGYPFLKNDIAVLRLNRPISLGYQLNVGTACLPAAGASFVDQVCTVAGWGETRFAINDAPTSPQKQVNVRIVSMSTCLASMSRPDVLGTNAVAYLDTAGEICAGGEFNKDACTGDGGAPLICFNANTARHTIAGLVNWGKNCGRTNVYGVYVNVPFYRNWIATAVANLNAQPTISRRI